jgi:hypothetical protein
MRHAWLALGGHEATLPTVENWQALFEARVSDY